MTKSPECVTKRALSFSVDMPFAVVTFLSKRLLLFFKMTTSFFNMEMKGLKTCFVLCQYRGVDLSHYESFYKHELIISLSNLQLCNLIITERMRENSKLSR